MGFRSLARRMVIVTTKDDHSFRGLLWQTTRSYVVLRGTELLRSGSADRMEGEVVLPLDNVSFLQFVDKVDI